MTHQPATRGDLGKVLLAEWTKFRTVRSTFWTLISSAVVTIALGVSLLIGILQRYDRMSPAARANVNPAGRWIWYHGLQLGQVMLAVLGVLTVTAEYGTGTIRATLAAVPRRSRVFTGKILGFAALALVFGAVLAFTMFAIARPFLAGRGWDVPLTDPTALRGVGLAALATVGVALLGVGTGLLIRHTAGAVTTLLVIMLGIPVIGQFVPENWQTVTRYLVPETAWAMFTPDGNVLTAGPGAAVLASWVTVVLGAAAITFHRRSA
jgi:ABC-2 type transport system permease protein